MKLLDIGAVARQAKLPPSTLRYYEDIGLIEAVARHGLRRQYAPDVLAKLALISWAKAAGFSLTETARMFGKDGSPNLDRPDIHRRADALEARIAELQALACLLRHVADCPAPAHMECPTFRKRLNAAA